ncbi:MAG: hypothetical protein WA005_08105 [Candidatus Binataceae bacterium]
MVEAPCIKRRVCAAGAILVVGCLIGLSSAAERPAAGETSAALPSEALLVATIRWGSTTLSALDLRGGALVPIVTKPSAEMDIAAAPGRVAYLVREGSDPTRNYVETLDLRTRRTYRFKPPAGFALLGFALDPARSDIAYSAMDIRNSRSRRAYWQSALADLETGKDRIYLSSGPQSLTGEAIPIPFGWSPSSGEIYFRGLMPFRGSIDGDLWAMREDGSGLIRLLADSEYVGRPALSPDGSFLAYLSSRADLLPVSQIRTPGAPPGNTLTVMDLATGRKTSVTGKAGVTFGCVRWSAADDEVMAERREPREGGPDALALVSGSAGDSFQLRDLAAQPSVEAAVVDIARCRAGGPLFWVERDQRQSRLRTARSSRDAATLLALGGGELRVIGCLGGNILERR